ARPRRTTGRKRERMTSPSEDDLLTVESFRFLVQREAWMDDAACKGSGPSPEAPDRSSPFFPKKGQSTATAYKMCASCPVTDECEDYRRRTGSVGIWGGKYTEHPSQPKPQPVKVQDGLPRKVVTQMADTRQARQRKTVQPSRIAARKAR